VAERRRRRYKHHESLITDDFLLSTMHLQMGMTNTATDKFFYEIDEKAENIPAEETKSS
jgi:hypothetical protein